MKSPQLGVTNINKKKVSVNFIRKLFINKKKTSYFPHETNNLELNDFKLSKRYTNNRKSL